MPGQATEAMPEQAMEVLLMMMRMINLAAMIKQKSIERASKGVHLFRVESAEREEFSAISIS